MSFHDDQVDAVAYSLSKMIQMKKNRENAIERRRRIFYRLKQITAMSVGVLYGTFYGRLPWYGMLGAATLCVFFVELIWESFDILLKEYEKRHG